MCTIVALLGVRRDFPLIIATNRDEFYARPTTGPLRLLADPPAVGGRDLRAGGTWMGVTQAGLFVGVTNQHTMQPPDPGKRSRGQLVLEALKLGDADSIRRYLNAEDGRAYNSFNLMFGSARTLYAAYGREDQSEIEIEPVLPGIHVMPNDRLDSCDFWKVGRAKSWLSKAADGSWGELRETLKSMLADGGLPPLESLPELPADAPFDRSTLQRLAALCVRTANYGSRSSTIVALSEVAVVEYWFADGPPDQTEFVDVMGLF